MLFRRTPIWIACLFTLLIARGLSAALISEIATTTRDVTALGGQTVTLPTYVEVSELSSLGAVDLIIIDARNSVSRYGQILQIVSLGGSNNVRVASGGAWADSLYGAPLPANTVTNAGSALNLTGSRAVLVTDRATTGLSVGSMITRGSSVVGSANVLDVVTLGAAASTWNWSTESIITLGTSNTIARTYSTQSAPTSDVLLTGIPNSFNQLTNYTPTYTLNPGLTNTTWSAGTGVPEPGTLLLVTLGLLTLVYRRSPVTNLPAK